MKRKSLGLFITVLNLLCFAVGLAACTDRNPTGDTGKEPPLQEETEHVHDFGEWTIVIVPTCEADGEEMRVCKTDASHIETREIESKGHQFENRVCSACGTRKASEGLSFYLSYDMSDKSDLHYVVNGIGSCQDADIILPEKYNDIPVNSISPNAFKDCMQIESVYIPATLKDIRPGAFLGCTNLKSVALEEGIVSLGEKMFQDCSSLTDIILPSSLLEIGNDAFEGCSSLADITLPSELQTIGNSAFSGCSSLERIVIPNENVYISSFAFSRCTSLTEILLPEEMRGIALGAFFSCTALTEITLPKNLQELSGMLFYQCTNLIEIEVPETVTTIGQNAFYGCESLTRVKLPKGLETIEFNAFRDCVSLTEIQLPDGLTQMEGNVFSGCSSLSEIEIPGGITKVIGGFENCTSLESVVIKEGITEIGERAFEGCENLVSLQLPNSLLTIGENAFLACKSLEELVIPDNVTYIGGAAFFLCYNLRKVTIGKSVQTIETAFYCCKLAEVWNYSALDIVADSSTNGLVAAWAKFVYTSNEESKEIVTDDGFVFFDYGTSQPDMRLVAYHGPGGALRLPDRAPNGESYSILNYAFYGDNTLTSVEVPNGVTFIREGAFASCKNLISIKLSSTVSLDPYFIKYCDKLEAIYYCGTEERWNQITSSNSSLAKVPCYFYSEQEPEDADMDGVYDGNFWHYDENGNIVVWKKESI